jgi:uncharacterized protein (TIGR02996 family)
MLDRRPFIDAILENPDDDTSRLVYADYLEECGNDSDRARAEFIRIGCEVAKLLPDDPKRAQLERREDELLAEHARKWCRRLPGHADHWIRRLPYRFQWQRGFPFGASVDACDFLEMVACVLPDEAIFGVRLEGRGPEEIGSETDPEPEWLDRLVASPWLKLAGEIDLCDTHFCLDNRPDRFVKLIGSPYLSRLTGLYVHMDYIGLDGVRALIESPAPFRLRRMLLSCFIEPSHTGRPQHEDFLEAVRLVARAARMASLVSFDLDPYYDAEGHENEVAALLLASPHLPRWLDLRFGSLSALTPEHRAGLAERFNLIRDPGDE